MVDMEHGTNGDGAESKTNIIAEISRPGREDALSDLLDFVADVEQKHGFPQERIVEISLALEEALKNILGHSYRDKTGDIAITCKYDPWGKFMIVIVDSGDPSNILLGDVVFAGEEAPVDQTRRGAAKLIKKMVDNV